MNYAQLLFSFDGRVGRKHFWIWNIIYYVIVSIIGSTLSQVAPDMASIGVLITFMLLLVPDLAITAKRWHDRNKSNWYLLLNIPLVIGRILMPVPGQVDVSESGLVSAISLVALVSGVWILIECGFLKGCDGKNRFGEPVKS
jgi:uncharacterized membrane protein YhaH (DUF805 family)